MQNIKRITLTVLTLILCGSGTVTYAQTNSDALQQQLEQQQKIVEQKQVEKQAVNQEIQNIQQELQSIYNDINSNQAEMAKTQSKIDEVNQRIEAKKQEIVVLEDKILGRKGIMEKRARALQEDDNVSMMINLFFESDSISEFIQRASAASQLMDADKDILIAQKEDLQKIENDKKEIDKQEQVLEEQQTVLAQQQAELDNNLQARQQNLTAMQEKYTQIEQQMQVAEQEKSGIQSQIAEIQAKIAQQQAAPKATAPVAASANVSGTELYVSATAYSHEDSGSITRLGYNIKANPNMKLIAVDPAVIPLGKRVWVEGYGEAIAGDTGGAIKGHRIDVLMPNSATARVWGRKTVKVVILN
ncbi:3D domain-containing protein [Neobacillus dielmonensis]|uniref:3D domain-containing protein n=1 Tax=Neobacillus dielmonensis TaxID=1347369 RepID=UPI0005A6D983|nr:3D domain-containing protein [Neobacillus dielmonensis]